MQAPVHEDISPYEQQALADIAAWRQPDASWRAKASRSLAQVWGAVSGQLHTLPGVEWTIENVVSGLLELTNEMTQDSIWTDAILRDFVSNGHPVSALADIQRLDLEHVDTIMMGLDRKYISLASVEGVATGAAGAAGIVPDLVALVALNLRVAGETATYCGFDMQRPEERLFALQILDAVARSGDSKREITVAPVLRTASAVARKTASGIAGQMGLGSAVEGAMRRLGMTLAQKKLTQLVPVTGALVGGGLNYLYTANVCRTCHYLYRERFLEAKYGSNQG